MASQSHDLEKIYQQGFVDNSLMMLIVDQETLAIIEANSKALSFYEYSVDELKAMQFNDLCVDHDLSRNEELRQGLSGELESFTVTQRTASGNLKYLEVYVTLYEQDNSRLLLMAMIDATQRQQTEMRLRDTESRYRIIADFNHDWEYWVTPDDLLGYVSPSCQRITGYADSEFLENPFLISDIIHPDDKGIWDDRNTHPIDKNENTLESLQFRIIHKDGSVRWIEHVSQIVIDENDVYLGHRASNRDITIRKEIEQELKQNKDLMELAVESTGMAVWKWDIVNNVLEYDEHWAWLLDYTYDEIQPMETIRDKLIHPQDKLEMNNQLNQLIDGQRQLLEVEHRLQNKHGEWRWFITRGTVIERSNTGQSLSAIGIDTDITNRKKADADYIQFELERQRISLLSTFIQDAKHEFKTPLSRINTKLYLMGRTDDSEKREKIAQSIEEQVDEIDHLVDSLVIMARLDTVKQLPFNNVNLKTIIDTLIVDVESSVKRHELTLYTTIPAHIPKIRGDTSDIYDAFKRIIDNAIRYTPPHGQINIVVKVAKSNILVEVRDTGAGISDEALPHIFERFYREDQAHTTSGIGLGLPIAKQIIEQHRGDIRISSEPDIGTIVQVRLPTRLYH